MNNASPLRTFALIGVLIGAVGSLVLLFGPGRNTPLLLIILYIGWVLSPYMGLLIVDRLSKAWPGSIRNALYYLMLASTIISLVYYSGLITSPETRPAAIFLLVPLASWILIVLFFLIAKSRAKRPQS